MTVSAHVVWHDVECGGYDADLELWRQLGREAGGPVLDVGAGTGRVALRLAEDGMDVTALDRDLGDSLDAAVANAAGEHVYALPTYTALLDLRDLLAERGLAKRWSE